MVKYGMKNYTPKQILIRDKSIAKYNPYSGIAVYTQPEKASIRIHIEETGNEYIIEDSDLINKLTEIKSKYEDKVIDKEGSDLLSLIRNKALMENLSKSTQYKDFLKESNQKLSHIKDQIEEKITKFLKGNANLLELDITSLETIVK